VLLNDETARTVLIFLYKISLDIDVNKCRNYTINSQFSSKVALNFFENSSSGFIWAYTRSLQTCLNSRHYNYMDTTVHYLRTLL